MTIARCASTVRPLVVSIFVSRTQPSGGILSTMLLGLSFALISLCGCGQTAKSVTSPAAGEVDSYFGTPFNISGSNLSTSNATFDHATGQISVSALVTTATTQVPTLVMEGTVQHADSGFLKVTEGFATTGGVFGAENPPVTGAWAVEIPGAGALANFLSLHSAASGLPPSAAPAAMAENAACPDFLNQTPFLYVTVPRASLSGDTADYGTVKIATQGSDVTLSTTPYLIGAAAGTTSTVTGGCSDTNFGALTAYPVNSYGSASSLDLISIGAAGLLVSSHGPVTGPGVFGGGTGVIGVAGSSAAVNVSAVVGAKYNGFVYDPLNGVMGNYDITDLASSFGDNAASSAACSALETSLIANNGVGIKSVAAIPSASSLYGGEYLSMTGAGLVNDPTGASGSENCDTVIDLGMQDSTFHGLFPNATVFIGSNIPPFSTTNPWICPETGSVCAVSFPATAIVAQIKGQYVIFVVTSATSSPAAQLPDATGIRRSQPIGIYLFQRAN
jgi:hypothetical protein